MRWAIALLLLALVATAHADNSFQLANGLKVYVIEDHKAPTVYEVMWFRVGSKDEVANRTGFAHLFEHLMFKGSAHLPDGLMDKLLEGAGGWSNAFTSSDMTVYQNVAASNFLETMLWIDADRLGGLLDTFDQAKLDNQRDVVLNERRQSYENQPYGMSELIIQENLWPKNFGYHWSTIGYPEDLKAASVPDVAKFFRTYYVPNNATMVVAGDVKLEQVKALVEKYYSWIPRQPEPARPVYKAPPPLTKEIVVKTTDDVQVPRVYLAWRGPAAFNQTLREKMGITYGVHAGMDWRRAPGPFVVGSAIVTGATGQGIAKALEMLDDIAKHEVPADELEKTKRNLMFALPAEFQTNAATARTFAGLVLHGLPDDYYAHYADGIRKVTAKQVQAVAAAVIPANKMVIAVVGDMSKIRADLDKLGLGEPAMHDLYGN